MKTGLIETDVTFNVEKLQSEYSKLLEEFAPFEREMATPQGQFDNLSGYCLKGIDQDNLGEISHTKYYKEKYNKDINERDFCNNTILYRGYFEEILNIID